MNNGLPGVDLCYVGKRMFKSIFREYCTSVIHDDSPKKSVVMDSRFPTEWFNQSGWACHM